MNGLQIGYHVEEMMVPLTSSRPEPVKYGSKVKNKDQDQGCSDHARKEHPLRSQVAWLISAVWFL